MAMTTREEMRLAQAESKLNEVIRALNGVGSKDQLNRLFVVLSREIERIKSSLDDLETETSEVLELARKVQ